MTGKIVVKNKPHLLGKHYPSACFVPTLAKQAALFFRSQNLGCSLYTLYKDKTPLYDTFHVLIVFAKNRTALF